MIKIYSLMCWDNDEGMSNAESTHASLTCLLLSVMAYMTDRDKDALILKDLTLLGVVLFGVQSECYGTTTPAVSVYWFLCSSSFSPSLLLNYLLCLVLDHILPSHFAPKLIGLPFYLSLEYILS